MSINAPAVIFIAGVFYFKGKRNFANQLKTSGLYLVFINDEDVCTDQI